MTTKYININYCDIISHFINIHLIESIILSQLCNILNLIMRMLSTIILTQS